MNASRILLASLALAMLSLFPAGAAAAELVPPGNSAANQYTETFPTAGGNAEAKGKGGKATPNDVLGSGNAKKLDSKGKQGREAAAVVAATAPAAAGSASGEQGRGNGSSAEGGANGAGGSGNGQGGSGGVSAAGGGTESGSGSSVAADSDGSSGLSEVLGQATGSSSSGGIGLLLPLVVLASVIWAAVYFLRRHRRTA